MSINDNTIDPNRSMESIENHSDASIGANDQTVTPLDENIGDIELAK